MLSFESLIDRVVQLETARDNLSAQLDEALADAHALRAQLRDYKRTLVTIQELIRSSL